MKNSIHFLPKKMLLFCFLLLSFTSNAQHFTITLANLTSTTNTFEVDVVFTIDAPTQGVKFSGIQTGINYNTAILNGGTPCTDDDCGSFEFIPGTRSAALVPLAATLNSLRGPSPSSPTEAYGQLRIFGPIGPTNPKVDIPAGTYTLGRYRFTNTVPWAANEDAQLWLSNSGASAASPGSTNTFFCFYTLGTTTPMYPYTTSSPANGTGLTLGYTQSTPLSRVLNPGLSTPENSVNPLQVAPNPFSTDFQLNFETVSNEQIAIKVYDMIGKLIDNRIVEANTINTIQIGTNYQAGIYNVSVSQGENTQTVRVIKR